MNDPSNEHCFYANLEVHRKESVDFRTIHPELYNKTEFSIISHFIRILKSKEKNKLEVLDIACGTGRLTHFLLKENIIVTGCDTSSDMLKQLHNCIAHDKKHNLTTYQGTIESFIQSNKNVSFDAITMGAFLHHVPNIDQFLSKAISVLRPDGYLFIIHDPALRYKKKSLIGFILEKIDSLLFQLWYFVCKRRFLPRSKEYSAADIHTKYGIDTKKISNLLENSRCEIIECKEYFIHKTKIITFIDSHIFKALPQFYLIAKKKKNMQ